MALAMELARSSSTAPASGRLASGSRLERNEGETGREGPLGKLNVSISAQQFLRRLTKRRHDFRMCVADLLEHTFRGRVNPRLRRLLHTLRALVRTNPQDLLHPQRRTTRALTFFRGLFVDPSDEISHSMAHFGRRQVLPARKRRKYQPLLGGELLRLELLTPLTRGVFLRPIVMWSRRLCGVAGHPSIGLWASAAAAPHNSASAQAQQAR